MHTTQQVRPDADQNFEQQIPSALQALSMALGETNDTHVPSQQPARSNWALPLALLPALTGFAFGLGDSPQVQGAEVPGHVASARDFGNNAWKSVQPAILDQKEVSARHWNDLEAVMLTADNAAIHEVQTMRNSIVRHGITNAEIPARIVHAALYSSAEYVSQLSRNKAANEREISELQAFVETLSKVEGEALPADTVIPVRLRDSDPGNPVQLIEKSNAAIKELQRQNVELETHIESTGKTISQAAIPYLGKVIVDSESSEGVSTRVLVSPSDAKRFDGKDGMTLYNPDGFEKLASFVIGKCGTRAEFELVQDELKRTDLRSERAELLFDVFLYAGNRTEADVLLPRVEEFVFRTPEKIADVTQFKLVQGIPTFITVPPTNTMEKTLAPLAKIDRDLIKAMISDPFSSDPKEQMAFAKAMLYLAQQDQPRALSAIGQWYTIRATKSSVASGVDTVMLEALGEICLKSDAGFELLLSASAGNPDLMEKILEAPLAIEDTAEHRAGRNFLAALRAHPEKTQEWIRAVADGKADTLLPPVKTNSDREKRQTVTNEAREQALKMMVYLDTRGLFVDYLKNIVENPFAGSRSSSDMKLAMTGLALQRDEASIGLLLRRFVDPSLSDSLRQTALSAALYIDTPDIIPQATHDAVRTPFSHANLLRFAPHYNHETGERIADGDIAGRIDQMMESNPFQSRAIDRYIDWLARTEAQIKGAQTNGQFPEELSREDKLKAYLNFKHEENGRSGSLLSVLQSDLTLKEEVVRPLIDYLRLHRDPRRHIDPGQAQMVMEVLSRAGITEAQELIVDMVKDPARFASTDASEFTGFSLQMHASTLIELKAAAIEALGGMVNLDDANDPASVVLHTIARKESSSIFRDATLVAFNRLADRYEAALAQEGADVEKLTATRNQQGSKVTAHLLHHAQGLDSTGQIRLRALDRNFAFARTADRLGGTADLIRAANTAAGENPDVFRVNSATETDISLRPDMVRSVMHALISNGRTIEDLKALGLDAETEKLGISLFQFVDNEVYWLGEAGERRYSGAGTDIVVLDAGYVYPLPMVKGLAERVLYPVGLEGYDPVQRLEFESSHPTAVAATAHEKAPDATIHSYNAWGGLREVPFRPEGTQGEVVRALEHIVERQLRGEVDFDTINYSFSYSNYALLSREFREELLDLTGAYMELASSVGIKHSISAGNSRGDSPAGARYGGLGEVNALGLRFTDSKKYEQPDGVFIAGAQDAFSGARLTEFTSSGDPLVPNNDLRVISYDGANVLLPWVDGKWVLMPINGTSFSAPNQEAMLSWADEAFEKAGVTPSMAEWRGLMNNSKIQMPHYADYEGGAYFHVASFMREINKIIEAHRQ